MRAASALLVTMWTLQAAAWDVTGSVRLLNRFNYQRDNVQTLLLYDEAAGRFLVEDFLKPSVTRVFSTHVVGGLLDVDLGAGWSFTGSADSGVLKVGSEYLVRYNPFTVGTRTVNLPVTIPATSVRLTANGLPLTDELTRSLFLREAFFSYAADKWLRVTFGKKRTVLLDGWLYDQFAFGAGLTLDGSLRASEGPWRLTFDVLLADGSFDTGGKRSPIFHAGIHYLPGPFQHFGLTLIYFHDGDNLFAEVFRTSVVEASVERAGTAGREDEPALVLQVPFSSSGDLLWVGLSGKRFLGDHTVTGAFFGQIGQVTTRVLLPAGVGPGAGGSAGVVQVESQAMGVLADLTYQYDLSEDLVLGAFFTFASGDEELIRALRQRASQRNTTNAFLSLFPFVGRSNLFFNGGLSAEFTGRRASTVGVNARGLVIGGAWLRWEVGTFELTARATALGAHRPSIYEGRYYGTELDLLFRWQMVRGVALVTEVDSLFAGNFFANRSTIFQAIVGIDVVLP